MGLNRIGLIGLAFLGRVQGYLPQHGSWKIMTTNSDNLSKGLLKP